MMNLEEEVDHYLAGLRDSNFNTNDATIALEPNGNKGQEIATSSSGNEFRERRLKANRQLLPAGLTPQVASCDVAIYIRQQAVVRSRLFEPLNTTACSPSSSTRVAALSMEESIQDADKSNKCSAQELQNRAFIGGTQHQISLGTLAPGHSEAEGADWESLSEASNVVDVAADDELDIIQHYAPSKSSEASLSGQSMPAFGQDSVLAKDEDYQALPSSSEVEEEEWDDCRVAEL